MTKTMRIFVLSLGVALLLAGCGLSEEPEIAMDLPLPTAAPTTEVVAAAQAPDLTAGAFFYAEHCAMCHGPAGQGDGEMVLDGRLTTPPGDFSDPETTWAETPAGYMEAVTQGNILAGMPPFEGYTEQERWDATAYVYLGAITAEEYDLGAQVYAAECAACHGDGGQGDGPAASAIMPDFTDLDFWMSRSSVSLAGTIAVGIDPEMPAFGEALDEAELNAVTRYVQTLAVVGEPGFVEAEPVAVVGVAGLGADATPTPEESPTEAPAAESEVAEVAPTADEAEAAEAEVERFITVNGEVVNQTADGALPVGETLTLHIFDTVDFSETTFEYTLDEDGAFTFTDVPYQEDGAYLVSIRYQDVFFGSAVYSTTDLGEDGDTLTMGIEIYETTTDPSVIRITDGIMRITFSHFGMEVGEVLSIENTSDRIYLSEEPLTENRRIALEFPLPPGAANVGFEVGMDGTRFFFSEDGTTIIDAQPVRPGTQEVFFSYIIPYEDGAIIDHEFLYPLEGRFHLLIESGQVTVESDLFTAGASEPVDMSGMVFDSYTAEVELAAGEVLSYTLSGVPEAVAAMQDTGSTSAAVSTGGLSPLVLGLVIAGLLFIGVGGFMFLLRQDGPDPRQAEIDDLLDRIAELDEQNESGMLNHDYYQRTRDKLKQELAALMRAMQQDEDEA